jgi:hypothetical protein
MRNKFLSLSALFILISFISCETLENAVNEANKYIENTNGSLTTNEVVKGLKEALNVGTTNAVSILSTKDGYYKNNILKINLPPEAKIIIDNKDNAALKAIGITKMIDDVILRMNRAAEDAAKKTSPILKNAITNMSISDAWKILKGADNAATEYFKKHTSAQLESAIKPVISESLNKKIVAGVSANQAWSKLAKAYNSVAKYTTSLKPVNADLTAHTTKKALNGLFIKIAEKEKDIRKNASSRVTDILKKVFDEKNQQ